jgi:hypothetical protein
MCSIDCNRVSNNPYKNNVDMKANEAPEKIYYAPYGDMRVNDPITENDIEYTRTDAFIEKACDAYCAICDTKECGGTGECIWVEKFRKRLMK